MALAGSWPVVGGAHIQAFTFFVSKSRSVVRGAVVCCVCMRVLCCVVCVVCGVGVWWWCCVGVCGCCVGVVWVLCCVFLCVLCCFSVFFSQFSSFSFLLSLFLSSLFFPLFSLISSLPLSLLSSLLATKHCGKNRSTNTASNFEAFECDMAQGKCTAVGSLPPPLPSLLPSPPPFLKKKKWELFITGIFPARDLFFITVLN